MTPAGGLPGPQFQALPEPAPLPRLPRPDHQLEAEDNDMSPGMAPMTAPGGEPQPGAQYQVTVQDTPSTYVHVVQSAVGFYNLREWDRLSIISRTSRIAAQSHVSCTGYDRCEVCTQAKPVKNGYFGTLGRRLQQGPEDGPPGSLPENDAFAAETPMSAPGRKMGFLI